jgi:adenylosuccinate lyase
VFPDAFHLAHYLTKRLNDLLKGLYVNEEKMYENTQLLGGVLYSSHLLLHLVQNHDMTREKAYEVVQSLAHSLKPGEHLKDKILKDKKASKYFSKDELKSIFSGKKHLAAVDARLRAYLKG